MHHLTTLCFFAMLLLGWGEYAETITEHYLAYAKVKVVKK